MAEALAILGGGAAAIQLLKYGCSITTALSRQRHAPKMIQSWEYQAFVMVSVLDNIRDNVIHLDKTMLLLAKQYRSDLEAIRFLLNRFRSRLLAQRHPTLRASVFVLLKGNEIESKMELVRRYFVTLAVALHVLSVNRTECQLRQICSMGAHNSLTGVMRIDTSDDLFIIAGKSNRGIALFFQGQLAEAEYLHCHVHNERQRILGNEHHETIKSKANIAMTINEMGQHERAEILYREALTLFEAVIGRSHPDTLKTYTNLAIALHDQGRYEQAEQVVVMALPIIQSFYGPAHEEFLEALEFRATLLHCMGMYAIALDVASRVFQNLLGIYGYEHYVTQRVLAHVRNLVKNCNDDRTTDAFISSNLVTYSTTIS